MSTVLLCSGKYAKTPYYIKENSFRIYSIEELSYCIYRDAGLFDSGFVCDELIDWIRTELELPKLADQLMKTIGKEDSLRQFAQILFSWTGYYTEEEIGYFLDAAQNQDTLSLLERKKERADAFLKKHNYVMAQKLYEELLLEALEDQTAILAKLYHNLGVCFARQFLYGRAADCFKKAYQTYANTESYVQFLSALKMGMNSKEYLDFLSRHPESYEDSLEVESRMREYQKKWENSQERQWLVKPDLERDAAFYEEVRKKIESEKEEYREMAFYGKRI